MSDEQKLPEDDEEFTAAGSFTMAGDVGPLFLELAHKIGELSAARDEVNAVREILFERFGPKDEGRHGFFVEPSWVAETTDKILSYVLDQLLKLADSELSKAAVDVLAERRRQILEEMWTPEHDDKHTKGELGWAAACYLAPGEVAERTLDADMQRIYEDPWPWDPEWDKRAKHDRRRQLVIGIALGLAELERYDRAQERMKT